ncbi:lipid IV(A) palmitoyltransferase PagP, partial [Propionivibrio sp.]
MNFSCRRKVRALLICYGVVCFLFGGPPAEAQAPAPLRVDPVLLGLPPVKPAEMPAPASATTPASPTTPADKARSEAKPVEVKALDADTVETRPLTNEQVASPPATASQKAVPKIPERTAAPPSAPSVSKPLPTTTPLSPVPVIPMPTPPAPDQREEGRQEAKPAPVRQVEKQPEPEAQSPTQSTKPVTRQQAQVVSASPKASATPVVVSSSAPLRVDPALLGLPPAAVTVAPQQSSVVTEAGRSASAPNVTTERSSGRRTSTSSPAAKSAEADRSWYQRVWHPIANAYNNGAFEFYLPLETYHLRSKYSAEKIATFQEKPFGFGVGRGGYNEHGNWEGVYAMGFQDSHFKPSYIAGYGWKAIWHPAEDVRLGLGYTAALMTRADIANYIPFPVVLPMASLAYKNLSLETVFVPGAAGAGNIFFIWAKWELGKKGEAIGTPAQPVQQNPAVMANTSFGPSTPVARQRVPYGPVLEPGSTQRLASSAQTEPPRVPATGRRDEEEVPDPLPPLALRYSKKMVPPPKESAVPRPVFLSAYRMGGEVDREFSAEGEAELRKIGTVVNADRLTYWPIDDEVEAEGNARLEQGEDLITGPKMRMKLEDQVGFFEQPSYTLKRQPAPGSKAAADKAFAARYAQQQDENSWLTSGFAAPRMLDIKPGQTKLKDTTHVRTMTEARGEADRIDFEGENQVRMTNATYTTCAPGNDDWYAKVGSLKLDYDREVA